MACGTSSSAEARPKKGAKGTSGDVVRVTNRMIEINDGINLSGMKKAQRSLLALSAKGSDPIWIRINSPGGSVSAGLILIDTMKAVDAPIHCIVESQAYSMGAIILSYCDKRYGYRHATFMLHEASYGTVGDDPSNRSKIEFLTNYLDRLHVEIAKNMGMDPAKYRARIRDAWWLLADEAKKVGLIHDVIDRMEYVEYIEEKVEEKRTVTYPNGDARVSKEKKIPKRRD